jgi:hypothetical protein
MFLQKELKEKLELSRNQNPQNGNDSEIITASNILQALSAEISWGSRNEDNCKIDLLISFNHPWNDGQRVMLLAQIKSGNSFGKVEKKIKIYKRGIYEAKKSLNNILLIWFDHSTKENYWTYVHQNTVPKIVKLGRNHILSPATRFEVARCINKNINHNKFNSRGIILDFKRDTSVISKYRKDIKLIYRNYKEINNPIYGNISFTNYGWKHMFRKTRLKKYKLDSLIIIPYLKQLLRFQPDRHWVNNFEIQNHKKNIIYDYEHILRYENIKNNLMDDKYEVVIKLIEEVGFPQNWKLENLLSQKIKRKVILKSCSLKKA